MANILELMKSRAIKIICACCILILILLMLVQFSPSGPLAIRAGHIEDPILRPAIESIADEVDAAPGDPKSRIKLGLTYEGAGMNELAGKTYAQYCELFPDRVIGWYRHAIVSNHQGKIDEAIASLEIAAKLAKPKMAAPHWQLAFWYIDTGEFPKAKVQIEIAESKKPGLPQTMIARARIAIEEGNFQQAISYLESPALRETVPVGYVNQLLGRAYLGLGDETKAEQAWSEATMHKPKWADPWTQVVVEHVVGLNAMRQKIAELLNQGNTVEARKLINEYFSFDESNRVVRRLSGACSAREGDAGSAMAVYSELLQEDPRDTVTMLLLAKLRLQIVQYQTPVELDKTRKLLNKILSITPDNVQAQQLLEEVDKE